MAINTTLATLSDQGFGAATAAYTVGLICAAVEFSSRRVVATRSADRELVGTGGTTRERISAGGPGSAPPQYGLVTDQRRTAVPWGDRFGRAALAVTVVGFAAHVVSVVARGIAAGRVPLGNMYEFISVILATVVGAWLVLKIRQPALAIGVFVLAPVTLLMYINGALLYVPVRDLQPALNSYWKWIHVGTVSVSSGVLMFSGIVSLVYLLRLRYDARGASPTSQLAKLPSVTTLDRIAYRTAILGFPVYTFAVITGALWAEVAWGRYWNWDPKETCAFVTWVIYAGYLHARATAGWRGRRAAWISVLGLASILFNLFAINLLVAGLHSYAGPGLN